MAAFDTIDHGTLLHCLSSCFGVGSIVLDLLKSYLSDHLKCVKIGSILSDAKKLLLGMPQGLLHYSFLMYYSPQQSHLKSSRHRFHICTDDMQLDVRLTHKNVAHTFDQLKACLDNVKKWLPANKLKRNADKSQLIIFGSKTQGEDSIFAS